MFLSLSVCLYVRLCVLYTSDTWLIRAMFKMTPPKFGQFGLVCNNFLESLLSHAEILSMGKAMAASTHGGQSTARWWLRPLFIFAQLAARSSYSDGQWMYECFWLSTTRKLQAEQQHASISRPCFPRYDSLGFSSTTYVVITLMSFMHSTDTAVLERSWVQNDTCPKGQAIGYLAER